jgi:hypothetical protein
LSPCKGKTIEISEVIFKWSLVTGTLPTAIQRSCVDVENGFQTQYEVSADKKSIGYQIKRFSKKKRRWFG